MLLAVIKLSSLKKNLIREGKNPNISLQVLQSLNSWDCLELQKVVVPLIHFNFAVL